MALGDMDADGYLDLVLGEIYWYNHILFNDGSGNFGDPIELPGGNTMTQRLNTGDVNGDGALDLVVGNVAGSENVLLINDGFGNFGEPIVLPAAQGTQSMSLGDVCAYMQPLQLGEAAQVQAPCLPCVVRWTEMVTLTL